MRDLPENIARGQSNDQACKLGQNLSTKAFEKKNLLFTPSSFLFYCVAFHSFKFECLANLCD